MPPSSPDPLTAAEWKVMNIVWRQKSCAARDVYQVAGQRFGWAPSTTKTLLRRLVDKRYLRTKRVGNSFLYRPARPALESLRRAADLLLESALEGTAGPLLAYMVRRSDLTVEELAELRSLLDKLPQAGDHSR